MIKRSMNYQGKAHLQKNAPMPIKPEKERKIKICIIEDSRRIYDIRLYKYCYKYTPGEEIYMIDKSKMDWIGRIEAENGEVQEFLESLVEKREEKRKQERSKF